MQFLRWDLVHSFTWCQTAMKIESRGPTPAGLQKLPAGLTPSRAMDTTLAVQLLSGRMASVALNSESQAQRARGRRIQRFCCQVGTLILVLFANKQFNCRCCLLVTLVA